MLRLLEIGLTQKLKKQMIEVQTTVKFNPIVSNEPVELDQVGALFLLHGVNVIVSLLILVVEFVHKKFFKKKKKKFVRGSNAGTFARPFRY